ncbi:MAG: hypothetical protein ACKVT0_09455 [Planctomycetaceae bacterium]
MRYLILRAFVGLMCGLLGCSSAASKENTTAPDAKSSYKHHRMLIWTVDKKSHAVKGFDEGIVGPSQEITLEPVANYTVSIRTGTIEDVTVTDFKTEWQEKHVPFRISHGSGSAEGTKDIENLFLNFEYSTTKKSMNLDSILIGIPVGSSATKDYLAELDRTAPSDALEDLLLIAVAAPEQPLDLSDLLQAYELLGKSNRLDRWKEFLKEGTPNQRLDAAGVLMKLGDAEGRRVFCKSCRESKGNLQVDLVDLLVQMPPSDEALATIVKLIVAPRDYLTQVPDGVGVADEEQRSGLIGALSKDYPREALEPYAAELRTWANSESGQKYGGEQVLELLDGK